MSYPFTYVNAEPIDLNRQDHRDEVIKRNKVLDNAINEGVDYMKTDIKVTVIVKTELNCLKCGTALKSKKEESIDNIDELHDIRKMHPTLKCKNINCQTKYKYSLRNEVYYPILKKMKF